jgi:hypothetical protein
VPVNRGFEFRRSYFTVLGRALRGPGVAEGGVFARWWESSSGMEGKGPGEGGRRSLCAVIWRAGCVGAPISGYPCPYPFHRDPYHVKEMAR